MEDGAAGRRYGTCATNKNFKVREVLEPLKSPPKRKTGNAEEVATKKKEKEVRQKKREEARISQEEAKKQLAKDIARMEDKQLRAKKAMQKVHPRHLEGT